MRNVKGIFHLGLMALILVAGLAVAGVKVVSDLRSNPDVAGAGCPGRQVTNRAFFGRVGHFIRIGKPWEDDCFGGGGNNAGYERIFVPKNRIVPTFGRYR